MRIAAVPRQKLLTGYFIWMLALVAVYYFGHGLRVESWGLLALSSIAAIVTGVVINRPVPKTPWLLLAAANLSFAGGEMSFLILSDVLRTEVSFPSFADILYLSTDPLYAIAVYIFIRWRTAGSDRRSLIDALTLTAGLALLSWIYLILPYAHNPSLSWLQKSFAMAYPLGDVLVLAMLARLLAPGPTRSRSVQLLTTATIGLLASDVSYGLIQLHSTFHNGTIADIGWAVFYIASGAAALHPSMADLTRPGISRPPAEVSPLRLAVLMLASFIAPIVLLIRSLEDGDQDASVIAVFSALLYLLVLSRLWDVATQHRRALDRERVLRRAGVSLASAGSVEQAAATAKYAAADLLGYRHAAQPPGEVLLAVREDGELRAIGGGTDSARLRERAETWLPLLSGSKPRLMTVADLGEQATALLPGAGADAVLLCPLTLEDRPSGDPLIGLLAVSGQHRMLADLSATMEILASQAALAVERVTLNQEVIRQGNQAYFRTLVQDTSDAILIVDDAGRVRYATPSATAIFGDVTVEGARLLDLVGSSEREVVTASLARMRDHTADTSDWRISRADGKYVQVEVRCSDLRQDSTVGGLVLTLRDVTERRELENTLTHLAFHDALTGLPNRLLFQDRIAHALAQAGREGTVVGVLFVDLDDFKVVNDTMGHGVGDELLVAVGKRLSSVVRDADTAARLGGDEFAILIEHLPDAAAAEVFAERVVEAFGLPFMLDGVSVMTRATVGIATTKDSADVNDLLRHADLALYAAKAAGKRGWRRYHPVLSAGLNRRRELQTALEEAVAESAFTLSYQPIVTLNQGQVVGFEALVRWPHPRWGLLQPGQFIALAEETGSIVPIGSWVLRQASADLAKWLRNTNQGNTNQGNTKRDAPLYVSVNVSARQFRETSFVHNVHQVLTESGLPASSLMLELTESVLLPHEQRIRSDLAELRGFGVRLAIDDFGTGYSSLSYLKGLPVDVIKIDKSFVDGIDTSEPQRALVDGIIRMARTLQLGVIAEGIENEAQRDRLVAMGCRLGQGYLLAKPMAAEEAEALVIGGRPVVPALPIQAGS